MKGLYICDNVQVECSRGKPHIYIYRCEFEKVVEIAKELGLEMIACDDGHQWVSFYSAVSIHVKDERR